MAIIEMANKMTSETFHYNRNTNLSSLDDFGGLTYSITGCINKSRVW